MTRKHDQTIDTTRHYLSVGLHDKETRPNNRHNKTSSSTDSINVYDQHAKRNKTKKVTLQEVPKE